MSKRDYFMTMLADMRLAQRHLATWMAGGGTWKQEKRRDRTTKMVRRMRHTLSGREESFFFSPMSEWTSRHNQDDKLPERVSLEQLLNEGWEDKCQS